MWRTIEYDEKYWICACPPERRIRERVHPKNFSHCALCGRNESASRRATSPEVSVLLFMLKLDKK